MSRRPKPDIQGNQAKRKGWRDFELLVTSIEGRLAPKGAIVTSPDKIKDIDTGRLREVDASIRFRVGSVDVLITIECRKRKVKADITWIESLATKRLKVGAAKTIAVSALGFSREAQICAERYGILVRTLGEVTEKDIDAWIKIEPSVHFYRYVESISCEVDCGAGISLSFSGEEARFRHPNVAGTFPGVVFLSFIEMKDPEIFWRAPMDGSKGKFRFDLDGRDPELVPVPLGVVSKKGPLEVLIDEKYMSVQTLNIEAEVSYKALPLSPKEGKHYSYRSPDVRISTLSEYDVDMLGGRVKIEVHGAAGLRPTATLSFPSGLQIDDKLSSPLLTDLSKVDISKLHGMPVSVRLKDGSEAEGIFYKPLADFFKTERQLLDFNETYMMFVEREDLRKFRVAAKENPEGQLFWEIVRIIPKNYIAHIDLTPAIIAASRKQEVVI